MNTDVQLTPHFNLREFLKSGSDEGVTAEIVENLRRVAQVLEEIRELLGGHPITITSGFRTRTHNAKVGGSPSSQHLLGLAADFVVEGLSDAYVQAKIAEYKDRLGVCVEITNGRWTHIDTRPTHHVFENLGNGKYKTLNVVEIKDFIRKNGKAA